MIDKTRFRNSSNGLLTTRLFLEVSYERPENVMYTIKRVDYKGYPSLYRLYMALEDPMEFEFANTFFDSYEHWEQICATMWFKEYIYQWRKELELKLRSKALRVIRAIAENGNGNKAFEANKFLLADGWQKSSKTDNNRGRPSKAEIQKASRDIAEEASSFREDFNRLGLN